MDNEALKQIIGQWEPAAEMVEEGSQYLNVITTPAELKELARKLHDDEKMAFDFMFSLTCVDYLDHLMMVYHLRSTKHGHEMVLKVKIEDRDNARVDTLCDIWRTAEWHEREVYDLFGVKFTDHPDLRRLLMTDDWVGYPLRKDYEDATNIVSL
jgi:NADH/F420H2 dehydrogenase subunit C